VATFMKNLSRLLGGAQKLEPAVHLAAFGKHPGWNDHIDDQGLDTDQLINAKRLLYVQGISQNIDAGAWDKLDPQDPAAAVAAITRLDLFCHEFLWHVPHSDGLVLLAGRLWSSSDGKGRSKYPMVLCSQATGLSDGFAARVVLPFLAQVHEQCVAATTAESVRQTIQVRREALQARMKDPVPGGPLTGAQVAEVAHHADMGESGFHRIVYQFVRGMAAYRAGAPSGGKGTTMRPEQVRVPRCGMSPAEALLFWLRFALTLLDPASSLLLIAPDQQRAPWVDLIAGEPSPANIFCIKAGPKNLPLTSDIPYTLDAGLVKLIDSHVAACAAAADAPAPAWSGI
jgi:hypothetical protein